MKKYPDHKGFDESTIIDHEFIETKDTEYLLYLVKQMEEYYFEERESSAIFEQFRKRVSEIAGNGGIR